LAGKKEVKITVLQMVLRCDGVDTSVLLSVDVNL